MEQSKLSNDKVRSYILLEEMYSDSYFPNHLVDQLKQILLELCASIEANLPGDLDQLYKRTHQATEAINELQDAFYESDSEIETAARDCIGTDFDFIASAYGFDADGEELIAPRDW